METVENMPGTGPALPAAGTLDQCRQQLLSYKTGILVQTVGEIETVWTGKA